MPSHLARTTVLAASAALAAGAVLAPPAQAAPTSVTQVRATDLIAPSDVADGGVQEFLAQGVHLRTVNATGHAPAPSRSAYHSRR